MAESSLKSVSFLGMLSCDVCFKDFDDADILPKVLPCGHTFCAKCLRTIVGEEEEIPSLRLCPNCKAPITNRSVRDMPTNFFLLQMLNESTKEKKETLRRRLSERKEELLQKKKNLVEQIESKISSMDTLEEADKIEKLLRNTNLSLEKNLLVEIKFDKPVAFTLREFPPQLFLHYVYARLSKGEKIYSMHVIDGNRIKYGRIELHKEYPKKFFVNSLTLDEVKEKEAAYILFSDLKKCATADNYEVFLMFVPLSESNSGIVYTNVFERIKMVGNEQPNVSQKFVCLCTGETGLSFPGIHGDFMKLEVEILSRGIKVPTEMATASEDAWPMRSTPSEEQLQDLVKAKGVVVDDRDQELRVLLPRARPFTAYMDIIKKKPENVIGFVRRLNDFSYDAFFSQSGIAFIIKRDFVTNYITFSTRENLL